MDIQPTTQKSTSDDQELAKVLAGVNEQIEQSQTTGLHFEETPTPGVTPDAPADFTPPAVPAPDPVASPATPPIVNPLAPPPTDSPVVTDPALESIKKDALNELRPLVDKLNVSSEEKFDTYLLLLRSTDDQTLIGPAHDAAKEITDETRRAQALLDIIKEIDYLSSPHAAAA